MWPSQKEEFWEDLALFLDKIPNSKDIVIGADLNGHIGKSNVDTKTSMVASDMKRSTQKGRVSYS